MEKELFIKHIKKSGVIILHKNDPNFDIHILGDSRRIKGFFKYIDFDCQINPAGGCKETPSAVKCCCYDCYGSSGYFRRMVDTDLTKYARHFSVKTGFWRKGKGCILHHTMRSTVCLTHHCNHDNIYSNKKDNFHDGIMTLKHRLHDLRSRMLT